MLCRGIYLVLAVLWGYLGKACPAENDQGPGPPASLFRNLEEENNNIISSHNTGPRSLTFYGSYELSYYNTSIGNSTGPFTVVSFLKEDVSGLVRVPPPPIVNDHPIAEHGALRLLLLSRPSGLVGVRLGVLRLEFQPEGTDRLRVVRLSGLDLHEHLALHGVSRSKSLGLATRSATGTTVLGESELCHLAASLSLKSEMPANSAREIDLRPADTAGTRWGMDDTDFGLGGVWDSRRLRQLQESDDIWGIVYSSDCGVRLFLRANEVNLAHLTAGVAWFVILFVLKTLGELRSFFAQVRYTEQRSSPHKLSYTSLALHVCVDCFDVVVLLGQASASNFMASAFVLLAVFKLLFASAVQLRFLILVVKARLANNPAPDSSVAARLSNFVKLHAAGTAVLLVITLKSLPVWPGCLTLLYFFWVPQIGLDAIAGQRNTLSTEYFLGMSICRLVLPLYLWGYPRSIFDGRVLRRPPGAPSAAVCAVLFGVVAIQVGLIVAQRYFGPRCFIPRACFPDDYDYHRAIPASILGASNPECVICMSDIDPSKVPRGIATTPCNHIFHDACLQRWLDIKPECPTCRGSLPPFI